MESSYVANWESKSDWSWFTWDKKEGATKYKDEETITWSLADKKRLFIRPNSRRNWALLQRSRKINRYPSLIESFNSKGYQSVNSELSNRWPGYCSYTTSLFRRCCVLSACGLGLPNGQTLANNKKITFGEDSLLILWMMTARPWVQNRPSIHKVLPLNVKRSLVILAFRDRWGKCTKITRSGYLVPWYC